MWGSLRLAPINVGIRIKNNRVHNARIAYGMCSRWKNLTVGSKSRTAESGTVFPWLLYDWTAKWKLMDPKNSLE